MRKRIESLLHAVRMIIKVDVLSFQYIMNKVTESEVKYNNNLKQKCKKNMNTISCEIMWFHQVLHVFSSTNRKPVLSSSPLIACMAASPVVLTR